MYTRKVFVSFVHERDTKICYSIVEETEESFAQRPKYHQACKKRLPQLTNEKYIYFRCPVIQITKFFGVSKPN